LEPGAVRATIFLSWWNLSGLVCLLEVKWCHHRIVTVGKTGLVSGIKDML